MKFITLLLITLSGLVLTSSCSKTNPSNPENLIIGTWVLHSNSNHNKFDRKSNLEENTPGMIIHADGRLTSRANNGFCGTPPISYDDFEGNWVQIDDSHYDLHFGYWGGTNLMKIKVIILDDHLLEWEVQ